MGKIAGDYKILSVNLLLSADRKTTDVEKSVADALDIKIGGQPLEKLEEFISVQACSYLYNKEDLLEQISVDYRTREVRKELSE